MTEYTKQETKDLIKKAYDRYKLVWLKAHEFSLEDFLQSVFEYIRESEIDLGKTSIADAMHEWEIESGFNSEIYPCFDEFVACDLDVDLFKELIKPHEFTNFIFNYLDLNT